MLRSWRSLESRFGLPQQGLGSCPGYFFLLQRFVKEHPSEVLIQWIDICRQCWIRRVCTWGGTLERMSGNTPQRNRDLLSVPPRNLLSGIPRLWMLLVVSMPCGCPCSPLVPCLSPLKQGAAEAQHLTWTRHEVLLFSVLPVAGFPIAPNPWERRDPEFSGVIGASKEGKLWQPCHHLLHLLLLTSLSRTKPPADRNSSHVPATSIIHLHMAQIQSRELYTVSGYQAGRAPWIDQSQVGHFMPEKI